MQDFSLKLPQQEKHWFEVNFSLTILLNLNVDPGTLNNDDNRNH